MSDEYFSDPWNPKVEEIRAWAFDEEAYAPEQDFELSLTENGYFDVVLELASNSDCPKRPFFLMCLYLIVGECFRGKYVSPTESIPNFDKRWRKSSREVKEFVESVSEQSDSLITNWRNRSINLFQNPQVIDYSEWCMGGIAFRECDALEDTKK